MKRTFSALLLCAPFLLASSATLAKNINDNPQSYGLWQYKGGEVLITAKGFEEYGNIAAKCRDKKQGYRHEVQSINGGKLLADLVTSQQKFYDDRAYQRDSKKWPELIDKDKNYPRLVLSHSCTEGEIAFVQINDDTGFYSLKVKDEYFSLAKKKAQ